jgi:hypothetical protein
MADQNESTPKKVDESGKKEESDREVKSPIGVTRGWRTGSEQSGWRNALLVGRSPAQKFRKRSTGDRNRAILTSCRRPFHNITSSSSNKSDRERCFFHPLSLPIDCPASVNRWFAAGGRRYIERDRRRERPKSGGSLSEFQLPKRQ